MAHDPISLLFRGSHETRQSFDVPRISGTVKATEIITPKGSERFLGEITFIGENVTIKLLINNYDDNTQPKLNWNGKYVLKYE